MMKKLKQISARTKILLFALILIILPSGILGYFGFRSLENRGLRLKENYRSMARLMLDKLEGDLLNLEGGFLRDIINKEWNQDSQTIKELLRQIKEQHPLIGEIFIMDTEGSVIHPNLILIAESVVQSRENEIQAAGNELIRSGEQYEFVERDYSAALRLYNQATKQASSHLLQSYARMLVARCYSKMKNYRKAEEEYRKLFEQGGGAQSPDGTPLKLIGLFQLSETYALLRDNKNQISALLELYEELISNPEGFKSYDFYFETVKKKIEQISQSDVLEKSDRDRLEKLRKEEELQMERTRFLKLIRQALRLQLNDYELINKAESIPIGHPFRYVARDTDETLHQIGYTYLSSSGAQTEPRILVYQIDKEFVLTELLFGIEEKGELGDKLHVGIINQEGSFVFPSQVASSLQALAVENFSQFFSWWRLALFDKDGKNVEQIVGREKQLYGLALVSIFILILAGIIMTLKAATHEVDMARLKSDFVSNVSHELKTPLALIRLFGETLELDRVVDAEKRKEFSHIIARESQRLSHLIDNVLDFSKIDSGQKEYTFEKEDLAQVLSSTLEAYKYYIRDHGFEFDVSIPQSPIYMLIDRDAISQALLNLLSNAEKFSKDCKYIGVKVIPKDSEVWIVVEDKGPGIPESNLKHIFNKFYRGEHGAARDVQGSGLGLTIVKHIVESHGGKISVESEEGKGSRFTIRLLLGEKLDSI